MIRGTVFMSNDDEVNNYTKYCEKHNINMFKTGRYEYVFVMKSKRLEKFMKYANKNGKEVHYISVD